MPLSVAQKAKSICDYLGAGPNRKDRRVSPHMIRHTTAMHLLPSSVDIAMIALWLGEERIETTQGYVETDLAMKENALADSRLLRPG
jgi:site-specific recombinase XerD